MTPVSHSWRSTRDVVPFTSSEGQNKREPHVTRRQRNALVWLRHLSRQYATKQDGGGNMFLSDLLPFESDIVQRGVGAPGADAAAEQLPVNFLDLPRDKVPSQDVGEAAAEEEAAAQLPPEETSVRRISFASGRDTSLSGSAWLSGQGSQGPAAGGAGGSSSAGGSLGSNIIPSWAMSNPLADGGAGLEEEGQDLVPGQSGTPPWQSQGWALETPSMLLQKAAAAASRPQLTFAEPALSLDLVSEDALAAVAARSKELPPLQSVLQLTSAARPPLRMGEVTEEAAPVATGLSLPDGSAELADGTRFTRRSGEELGANGRWVRWTELSGVAGEVTWSEKWWEITDYTGFKEMGAEKKGSSTSGDNWSEFWLETLTADPETKEPMVERRAHKVANCASVGNAWEEKWGEKYWAEGKVVRYADKWGREAEHVWHEKWGEDYNGSGGCNKYTDRWAERLREDGSMCESWGDKWNEDFGEGKGEKKGEVWSLNEDNGSRYNRYWGEQHFGEGWVRKYGHSNTGEHWDSTEQSGTYYNPIPHTGRDSYRWALNHSPQLLGLPTLPRERGGLGKGLAGLDGDEPSFGSNGGDTGGLGLGASAL